MLVKLIKNDYYNRGRLLLVLCGGVIIDALIMWFIYTNELNSYQNGVIGTIAGMIGGLCSILLYVSFPAILYYVNSDFGKRYFKDQGYFTHTLPVKTSFMLFARMICDVVNTIVITLTYLLVAIIVSDNIWLINDILDEFIHIPNYWDATVGEHFALVILRILTVFLFLLLVVWQYNAAYTAGHTGQNAKRIKSVVFFFVFYIVEAVFVSLINEPIFDIFKVSELEGIKFELFSFSFIVVLELIGIYCMGFITNYVFKRGLNLE